MNDPINFDTATFGKVNFDKANFDAIADARDGFTRKERAILYCLQQAQQELGGRNVPTIMLYGRVVELVDIGQEEFQTILARMVG